VHIEKKNVTGHSLVVMSLISIKTTSKEQGSGEILSIKEKSICGARTIGEQLQMFANNF